jgi:hypothetical protein
VTDDAGAPPAGGAAGPSTGGAPVPPAGGASVPPGGAWSPVAPVPQPHLREGPRFDAEEGYDTGRLQQLSTGQLLLVHRPGVPDQAPAPEIDDEEEVQRRVYSWIGAVVGAIGALASLFVGWMLPLSLAALVFGVLGLRREEHGRTLAFVAIGTGITGLVFSAVWLGYYAIVYGALPA